jgi:hypothetical protein
MPFLSEPALRRHLDSLGPLPGSRRTRQSRGGRANLPEPNLFQTDRG